MFRAASVLHFNKVAVWGAGLMGGGIAQVSAQAGIPVTIVARSQQRLDSSRKTIEGSLARVGKKKCNGDEAKMKEFVANVTQHITYTTDEKAAASEADIIIEAIVENIDVKKELFARLDKLAPKETVFCSNTSSLSIKDIGSVTSRPERVVGTHFFSPVPMMKLVEVVRTDVTDPKVLEDVTAFSKKIGKAPAIATDTEGFIVNRLFVPYLMEACRLVERGVASCDDVDTAMKLGCGYPMGPFELCDNIGIDVIKFIIDGWHKEFPDMELFNPVKLIDECVAAGRYGKKTGEGFYKYDEKGRRIA